MLIHSLCFIIYSTKLQGLYILADIPEDVLRALRGVAQEDSLSQLGRQLGVEVGRAVAQSSSSDGSGGSGGESTFFRNLGNAGTTLLDGAINFTGNLATGTAKISTLGDTVANVLGELPGIGRPLKALAGYGVEMIKFAEDSIDTLEGLSSSGASFNNSIIQMNYAASQSRLTLDEFSGIVGKNSEQLIALGGSVTAGAQTFSRMSNQFFNEGLGDDLINMGMTFEEVNENLMNYMEVNRRSMMRNEMSDAEARQNAAAMAKEMDLIAKLTGKNRKEMEAEIQGRMRSGQVQAKLRLLEMEGNKEAADNFRLALAEAEKAGPDAVAALEETFTKGTVVSEAGRRGMVALGDAGGELTNVVNAINAGGAGVGPALDNFNAAIVERVNSREFLQAATLGGMGGVVDGMATVLENAGPYADAVSASQQGAIDESSSRAQILASVRNMEESARNEQTARDGITHTMQMADARMKDIYAAMGQELYGPGNGVITNISRSNAVGGENGTGRQLDDLTRQQIQEVVAGLRATVPGAGGDQSVADTVNMRQPEDINVTPEQHSQIMEVVDTVNERLAADSENGMNETARVLEQLLTGPNAALALEALEASSANLTAAESAVAAIESNNIEFARAIRDEIRAVTTTQRANQEGIDPTTQNEMTGLVDAVSGSLNAQDAHAAATFNAENMTVSSATMPTNEALVTNMEQIQTRNEQAQTDFTAAMTGVNEALAPIPEAMSQNTTATREGLDSVNQTLSNSMDSITGKLNELLEATNAQTGVVRNNSSRVQGRN